MRGADKNIDRIIENLALWLLGNEPFKTDWE